MKGFTLIELLIVMLIIMTLIFIVIPSDDAVLKQRVQQEYSQTIILD